jgi:hypothetical protein
VNSFTHNLLSPGWQAFLLLFCRRQTAATKQTVNNLALLMMSQVTLCRSIPADRRDS